MGINKNNLTTYLCGALIFVGTYFGISAYTAGIYAQFLAPVLAFIIAYVVKYLDEKYPSSMVTAVKVINDVTAEDTVTSEEDGVC